jgi:hypothetical protein
MQITDTELGRMTALGGMRFGGSSGGSIEVHGITATSSNAITMIMSLAASGDKAQATFKAQASTFNTLAVQADDGILVQVDITTDVGFMTLDGDSDNAVDTHDKLAFNGARTLDSEGPMMLDSTSGGLVRSGAAAMTLRSKAGILLNDDFTGTVAAQALTINADTAALGTTGVFTVKSGKVLSSTNGVMSMTAADIQILGSITSGTGYMAIQTANDRTIGVGTVSQQMDIEGTELQRVTAAGLTIGKHGVNKNMKVIGVTKSHSNGITGTVTLLATVDDSSVAFQTTASTFFAIAAQADNGVVVKVDANTISGDVYFNGDIENSSSSDDTNTVLISNNVYIVAKTMLTLQANTGTGVVALGKMSLQAGSGIVLHDNVRGGNMDQPFVINAAYDAIDGIFTITTGKTVTSNNAPVTITAWDLDIQGMIMTGTKSLSTFGAVLNQRVGVGTSVQEMHISDSELQRITGTGMTIGGSRCMNVTVSNVSLAGSSAVAEVLSLFATLDDSQVIVTASPSVFTAVALAADNGVVIKGDIRTTTGAMFLDGDQEDSSSMDGNNAVGFTDGRTITAYTTMTLESSTGRIERAGTLTLNAGVGIVVQDDFGGAPLTTSLLVINADYESAGDGTFTVVTGKTVSTADHIIAGHQR